MFSLLVKLISSSFIGQFFNLIVLFSVARLVTPDIYGIYSLCIMVVSYIIIISSAKYHHAIFVVDIKDAEILVNGARIFCGVISLIITLILILLNENLDIWGKISVIDLIMVGLAGYFSSTNLFYYYLALKKDELNSVVKSRILSPLLGGVIMIILAYFYSTPSSLLVGYVITLFIANIFISNTFKFTPAKTLLPILKNNKKFPLLLLPSGVMESISASYIMLATSSIYGVESAAYIGMYFKIIASPQGMICSAISDTVRTEFSNLETINESKNLFYKVIYKLFLLAITASLILCVFTKYFVALLLGSEWSQAVPVFYSLVPLFFTTFIISPLSALLYVRDGTKYDLVLQVTLITTLACYHLLSGSESLTEFIFGYSVIISIKYCLELFFCYKCISNNSSRETA